MGTKLKRIQMLLEPDQHRALMEVAEQQGKSVSEVTRAAIDIGLSVMERDKIFAQREEALKRAEALRQAMRDRRGHPISIDVADDIRKMRQARDEHLLGRGH
jgi:uncharacterized protein (DUF1778 family)